MPHSPAHHRPADARAVLLPRAGWWPRLALALPEAPALHSRAVVALGVDVAIAALSLVLAVGLRVGFNRIGLWYDALLVDVPLLAACTAFALVVVGVPHRVWRYATAADVIALARAGGIALLLYVPVAWSLGAERQLPLSTPVIQLFLFVALAGSARMLRRRQHLRSRRRGAPVPAAEVLLAGIGDGSALFLKAMAEMPAPPYRVAGLLDPAGNDVGRRVHGAVVLGRPGDLERVVEALRQRGRGVDRVVVTESLDKTMLQRLLGDAERQGLAVCRTPEPAELRAAADAGELRLAPIALHELLGRPQVRADAGPVDALIRGHRVLVTGAGGSIGRELVRQIAACGPSHLALVEASEFNLYSVDLELAASAPGVERAAHLCDVRDRQRVLQVFGQAAPDLVFHAAALKHVPLVEQNVVEGVLTNVVGSAHVADAACAVGARAMVMVSTDKAVNPVGVMGATKRFAELYCQALDRAGEGQPDAVLRPTRLMTVRFGNVLGTSGSVIPLFQRQLAAGGPLTVTHPEITRYFMTVQEAVSLVLAATAHGLGRKAGRGEIFVLDMGEPVRIADVARQMIRLAGLEPERDIGIRYVGLRPGEKLYEELFDDVEDRLPPLAEGVLRASSQGLPYLAIRQALDELGEACAVRDEAAVRAVLSRIVPGHADMSTRSNAA